MLEILLVLIFCPFFALIFGNLFWNTGGFSRASADYYPRTEDAYRRSVYFLNRDRMKHTLREIEKTKVKKAGAQ